jgi:single-strand DNA-binding protein
MNNFSFTGNLGRDVEIRHTPSGMAIANFSVPVKSGYGDKEKTSWVRCAIIGKRAESGLMDYLKKGQLVGVTGELSVNEYTNKDGETKTSVEVFVKEIDLLGKKGSSDNFASAPAPQQASGGGGTNDFSYDDSIPF